MTLLIKNIKQLIQTRDTNVTIVKGDQMQDLPLLEDAYVLIDDDTIVEFGKMSDLDGLEGDSVIDARNKLVMPSFCDSHTHTVYAKDRNQEFVDRINGMSYEQIAERGGGILNSAKHIQDIEEDKLFEKSLARIQELIAQGTGALEIKSGYGLTVNAELKMLNVINRLKKELKIPIKRTLLAAHALPTEYKNDKSAYINLITSQLIPKVAELQLADYIDVFCEKGFFDLEDTKKILEAGKTYGLTGKIHVNQFNAFGGVKIATQFQALSVDHLEELKEDDIAALQKSATMPVALPGCSFFLSIPYTPARRIIDAGLPLALASDYNPGSAPTGNMHFAVSAACIKMNMTPAEAINASTINGAYAMELSNQYGSICRGKKANLIITKELDDYTSIPYRFGSDFIDQVIVHGEIAGKQKT